MQQNRFSHTKVIHLSQEIDKLIYKYIEIKKEPFKRVRS
ncbi:Spo0E family sporulation regulatory protein-aspartic acid phosphatase [Bacillus cereus group sp. BfR-BA-01315]|nr:Spo0E family sporulation regulatory protein-aspartic acid phosphatase [Bacillus cereus group sp. BfR-BA-01315]